MEENRSFDHMLGFMKRENPQINGLNGNEFNPYNTSDPTSPRIFVSDTAPYISPWDPCHSTHCVNEQVFGNLNATGSVKMNGFVQDAIRVNNGKQPGNVLNMFTPEKVPVISTLAREFALFDEWFCSVPSDTNPNRRFLHAATAYGSVDDSNYYVPGFPSKTVFESVMEVNLTTGIYYVDFSPACMFSRLRVPEVKKIFKDMKEFYSEAKEGRLPNYSFITPRMFPTKDFPADDQHPDHSVELGEVLMKDIYEVLRNGPLWNNTLFIITYDEHGGFFDHVPTPTEGVPNPDGRVSLDPPLNFTRLGIRVPAIMISPWINKGVLVHRPKGPFATSQYEHSSVAATLKKLWGFKEFLTKRDAWAGTFEEIYSERKTPRTDCPNVLPEVIFSMPREEIARRESQKPVNGWQRELMYQGCDVPPLTDDVIDSLTQEQAAKLMAQRFNTFLGRS